MFNKKMKINMSNINYSLAVVSKEFVRDISSFGGMGIYLLAIIIAFLAGERNFSYKLAYTLVIIFGAVYSVKFFYTKPRPGSRKRKFSSLAERLDASSFPSVHAARIVALSIAMHTLFPKLLLVWILLACGVGYSRVLLKKHDLADVTAGILIGIFAGYPIFLM